MLQPVNNGVHSGYAENGKIVPININGVMKRYPFNEAYTFVDGLALIKLDRKYGYLKEDGTFLHKEIAPFNHAEEFKSGIALVGDNNRRCYGFIDTKGNPVDFDSKQELIEKGELHNELYPFSRVIVDNRTMFVYNTAGKAGMMVDWKFIEVYGKKFPFETVYAKDRNKNYEVEYLDKTMGFIYFNGIPVTFDGSPQFVEIWGVCEKQKYPYYVASTQKRVEINGVVYQTPLYAVINSNGEFIRYKNYPLYFITGINITRSKSDIFLVRISDKNAWCDGHGNILEVPKVENYEGDTPPRIKQWFELKQSKLLNETNIDWVVEKML